MSTWIILIFEALSTWWWWIMATLPLVIHSSDKLFIRVGHRPSYSSYFVAQLMTRAMWSYSAQMNTWFFFVKNYCFMNPVLHQWPILQSAFIGADSEPVYICSHKKSIFSVTWWMSSSGLSLAAAAPADVCKSCPSSLY